MGNKRLSARLVKSTDLLGTFPGHEINANSASDSTAVSQSCRLVEMPAESAVKVRKILARHRERSIQRFRGQHTVLAIHDGTDLNFATRPGFDGLEVVGKNRTGAKSLGLHLHATLAVSDSGLPLGVLRMGFDAVKARPPEAAARRNTKRWLDGFADIAKAVRDLEGETRVVAVCDREADCCELFDEQRRHPRVDLLVRAMHDQALGKGEPKLFDLMGGGPPDDLVDIDFEGLAVRPARRMRLACCELRFRRVTLPTTEANEGAEPTAVSAVHVVEAAPPEGENPVQWHLLTTLDVRSARDAAEVVGFYLQRWRIEDFFQVLKSGCQVEFLRYRTADWLHRAVAINAVIAWRIMAMNLLGRQAPDCGPELVFADHELDFLRTYAEELGLTAPDRLVDAVKLVAHLGGYRDRKHDPDPGHKVMWHGQMTLESAALGHRIGFEAGRRKAIQEKSGTDFKQNLP